MKRNVDYFGRAPSERSVSQRTRSQRTRIRLKYKLSLVAAGLALGHGLAPADAFAATSNQQWDRRFTLPGVDGEVCEITATPSNVYIGGTFNAAGGVQAHNLAKWDGTNWSGFPGTFTNLTINGEVGSIVLAVVPRGPDLFVGGEFSSINGVAATNIARWDGTNWFPIGAGLPSRVTKLTFQGDTLYAGGYFVARWDGAEWTHILSTPPDFLDGLAANDTGLYAAASSWIGRWTGTAWEPLGSGVDSDIGAIAATRTDLYVGGYFSRAGGILAPRIARWDGTNWFAMPGADSDRLRWDTHSVRAITVGASNSVVVGGFLDLGSDTEGWYVVRWTSSGWTLLGNVSEFGFDHALYPISSLGASGDRVYLGGSFAKVGSVSANNLAYYENGLWSSLGEAGQGLLGFSTKAVGYVGTNLYVGGAFAKAGPVSVFNMACWNGASWTDLQGGVKGENTPYVWAFAPLGAALYVGGRFTNAGGISANNVARWWNNQWTRLGTGVNGEVRALAATPPPLSTVYAGGTFNQAGNVSANRIARWNGSSWFALGSGVSGSPYPSVSAIAIDGTRVIAGGRFESAGGVQAANIACSDGANWSPLGGGIAGNVLALAIGSGRVYAGGQFNIAGGVLASNIAQWDGSDWSPLGLGVNGPVFALAVNGSALYVGGQFTIAGGRRVANLARWDGVAWTGLDINRVVLGLAASGSELAVAGLIDLAGEHPSQNFAIWHVPFDLKISRQLPGAVRISWPAEDARYVLQTAPVVPTTNWSNVNQSPLTENGHFTVITGAQETNRWFRLRKP